MPTVAEVRDLVAAFDPGRDTTAARSRELVLELLARSPAPFSRHHYQPGHLTASGVVLSPDRRQVLLVYHGHFERWLQPGGHIEPGDATTVAAARREIQEETGAQIDDRTPAAVVGIDVHDIPAARGEPHHLHYDIAFRFVASSAEIPCAAERNDVVWCATNELERYTVDDALLRSVTRAVL